MEEGGNTGERNGKGVHVQMLISNLSHILCVSLKEKLVFLKLCL